MIRRHRARPRTKHAECGCIGGKPGCLVATPTFPNLDCPESHGPARRRLIAKLGQSMREHRGARISRNPISHPTTIGMPPASRHANPARPRWRLIRLRRLMAFHATRSTWNVATVHYHASPALRTGNIPCCKCMLSRELSEFVVHYHEDRNHQGVDNRLLRPQAADMGGDGPVDLPRATR
jgi:hypothetical protein